MVRRILGTARALAWCAVIGVAAACASWGSSGVVFRNIDGPPVEISVDGQIVGVLACGQGTTFDLGAETRGQPHRVVMTAGDGAPFGTLEVTEPGTEVRIRADGVVSGAAGGPIGPAPIPCS